MEDLFRRIEQLIPKSSETNQDVSAVSVGWHLDHTLQVIIGVSKMMAESNPQDYKFSFSIPRTVIMTLGKIPRGRGRAPKRVTPIEEASQEQLQEKLTTARQVFESTKNLDHNQFFDHHIFGKLKKKKTHKFLGIHSRHHLDICDDILK